MRLRIVNPPDIHAVTCSCGKHCEDYECGHCFGDECFLWGQVLVFSRGDECKGLYARCPQCLAAKTEEVES